VWPLVLDLLMPLPLSVDALRPSAWSIFSILLFFLGTPSGGERLRRTRHADFARTVQIISERCSFAKIQEFFGSSLEAAPCEETASARLSSCVTPCY
jgi:hypothetical protein